MVSLKIIKPRSPGQRHLIKYIKKDLLKKPLFKKNVYKCFRTINFKLKNFSSIVYGLEYDPNRSSAIAALYNLQSKHFFYMLAANKLRVGDIIKSGLKAETKIGHTMSIEKIPVGTCIYNLSYTQNNLAKISRAAGTYSIILQKTNKYAIILLNSKRKIKLSLKSFGTIGTVSNDFNNLTQFGKAGKSRWLNTKPIVRGVAKNPVDHPHGGGEGKTSGFRKTPWSKPINSPR